MTIDADIAATAKHWGLDPALIQSVVNAEGGGQHIVRAVQISIPSVTTRQEALEVTCRSAVHAMCDFIESNLGGENQLALDFVVFWGKRWAPVGATNDPHNLNANWSRNVYSGWTEA